MTEKEYDKAVLIVRIPKTDHPEICSRDCSFRSTSGLRPYNQCYLYGKLALSSPFDPIRHIDCASLTLGVEPNAKKNKKEIEETVLVLADKLEELGALAFSKIIKALLRKIDY